VTQEKGIKSREKQVKRRKLTWVIAQSRKIRIEISQKGGRKPTSAGRKNFNHLNQFDDCRAHSVRGGLKQRGDDRRRKRMGETEEDTVREKYVVSMGSGSRKQKNE